ncbi:hypothetical protein ACLOJK_039144 [Asimina triloba]
MHKHQQAFISSNAGNGLNSTTKHHHHKWVGPIGLRVIKVDGFGLGDFQTVQAAVDSVPENNTHNVIIQINAGYYVEKVIVPATKPYITFQGAGRDATVIEWHDRACDRGPDGQQLRTYHTASVTVLANYFTARNISFKEWNGHLLARHCVPLLNYGSGQHVIVVASRMLRAKISSSTTDLALDRPFVNCNLFSKLQKMRVRHRQTACMQCSIRCGNTAPAPQPGVEGWQAAAFRISGDKAYFGGCGFYGAQDTLCDDAGRHYFKDCYIEGSIDFIFGNGRSMYKLDFERLLPFEVLFLLAGYVFQKPVKDLFRCHTHASVVGRAKKAGSLCPPDCELHSIATRFGSIAAQDRRLPDEKTGFAFLRCRVTGTGPLYVGRAMGQYSRIVYSYTYFDDLVAHGGWDDWDHVSNKNKTVFFGVYKCWGPGAGAVRGVSWARELDYDTAHPFLAKSFVNGRHWIAPSDA